MAYPPVDLDTTTHLAVHWGWFSVTLGNLVVYVALLVVLVLGFVLRTRGSRRDLAAVEARNLRAVTTDEPADDASTTDGAA